MSAKYKHLDKALEEIRSTANQKLAIEGYISESEFREIILKVMDLDWVNTGDPWVGYTSDREITDDDILDELKLAAVGIGFTVYYYRCYSWQERQESRNCSVNKERTVK